MPKSKSVAKRLRQSEKRRLRNRAAKSHIKALTKKLKSSQKKEESQQLLRQVVSAYDRAVQKGVFHSGTAARRKSRLMKAMKTAKPTKKKARAKSPKPKK